MFRFSALIFVCFLIATAVAQPPVKKSDRPGQKEGAFEPGALGMKVPVITSNSDDILDKHVGRLVAVRGTVSNTKHRLINGVDVNADDSIQWGKDDCYAVGILIKWVVTPKIAADSSVWKRGPGTFYYLYTDLTGTLATAKVVPKK